MNIENYLTAYENYRDAVIGLKNALRRRNTEQKKGYLPVGEMIDYVDYEELEREYERKKRILAHATKRLQKAAFAIQDPRYSDYIICKYFYRMTNEQIAEDYDYSPRQVYRVSAKAKEELYRRLLLTMPRVRRWKKGRRFRYRSKRRGLYRRYGPRARAHALSDTK